ncbi:MAG TPA: hypothetical protein VK648_13795 [Gemmatimonadaceae bacterium]|nr:MAG: hypothetical protein DMF56_17615 [Acidobacteriota bacterium]HTD84856.1 hypothetical protein [Gemmatimonadaceae bacterium]
MDEETRLVPVQDESALTENETAVLVPMAVGEVATKIIAALDMIAALVPDLRKPHPATAKKVRGARTVPREAVSSIVAMVEASPLLQGVLPMKIDRAHEVLGSADAYRLLGERLDLLRSQVKYTAEARWAEVVAQAMQAYVIASTLAEDPKEAELAAHVATIRRHLGRRNAATGKRKKKTE